MKTISIYIVVAVLAACLLPVDVEAKWWIFGQSNDEVTLNYLYINRVSYEESGPKVTLYKESLRDGMIYLNGKASARSGKIGRVRVSLNGKDSWEKAKLADNGTFEYSFRPEMDKSYTLLVEAADTAGKTNDVEATRKVVSLTATDMMATVRGVLDSMIEAYRSKSITRFMSFVSENFAADEANLTSALQRDFSNFDNVDMRYTINNVASGAQGVYVSVNYNLTLTPSRNSNTAAVSEKGITEFVFKLGEAGPRLFSMKHPIIFGRSSASDIATGTVNNAANDQVITVKPSGEVAVTTFQNAQQSDWSACVSSGGEVDIFDNYNSAGVSNLPTRATTFTINQPNRITYIQDYHWNGGSGVTNPGTIALKHQNGTTYGPWQATGSNGQGGAVNVYWTVNPNVTVPAGTYTVIDSNPATWSQNSSSQNAGLSVVRGYPDSCGGS